MTYICLANVVISDTSRGFLNTTMYCEFKLMIRLSSFFLETGFARYIWRMYYSGGFFREKVRHALVGFGLEIV